MVDPGEKINVTLKREFAEEALNSLGVTDEQKRIIHESLEKVFEGGKEVFICLSVSYLAVLRWNCLLIIN